MSSSWLNLANQTAVVTGAASGESKKSIYLLGKCHFLTPPLFVALSTMSGIGRAVALALAREGCNLLLADVQRNDLNSVASACCQATSYNISIQTSLCDVVDKSHVNEAIAQADRIAMGTSQSSCNKASILVNSAGITRDGKVSNISDRDWEDVIQVNLRGTFNTCQAFCETERVVSLLTSGNRVGGSIINIGSVVSQYGNVGQVNYSASKGGVVGLTRSLAKEMALLSCKIAEENNGTNRITPAVRVNCIQPGFIETAMSSAVPNKILSEITSRIALRRLGRTDDVADLCSFLASSHRSGYITGEVLECSGMLRL
eukprot:CCRYP_015605-RA/>CCRYP_015605-RA protein AED:0.06 eAED:0.06 QI:171/0.5/0.33/1/1/1/3/122/315